MASKLKNKGTLFSPTLKVGKTKCPQFFILGVKKGSYGNFLVFQSYTLLSGFSTERNYRKDDKAIDTQSDLKTYSKVCQLKKSSE